MLASSSYNLLFVAQGFFVTSFLRNAHFFAESALALDFRRDKKFVRM